MKELPAPITKGNVSVEETMSRRRSVRVFKDVAATEAELSQLLWAAQGITETRRGFRSAPSAGATYPLVTYLVTAKGIDRYHPDRHALERVRDGDLRTELAKASLQQMFMRFASACIVFSAVYERTTDRYGKRGKMYVHMEAGHAAQNVHLQAVSLGMGSVPIGAFDDDAVAKVLKLPKNERPIYIISVGR